MKKLKKLLGIKRIEVVSNKAGFTLIELIVVIAIMGIATSAIFSMNLFGIKTFASGQSIAQKQFETRTAADFITKQLRYASSVTFLTSIPTPTVGAYDIYLNGGSIVFNNNGVKTIPPGLNNVSDFTLTFLSGTNNVLNYTVGKTVNTEFNITSQVTALNSPSFITVSAPIGIRYTYNTSEPTTAPPRYDDLIDVFEKNVINVIGDSFNPTPFNMSITLNTLEDISHGILIKTNSVSFGGGTNIKCNLAIRADTIDLSGLARDKGDTVFDVSTIKNSASINNGFVYLPSNLINNYSTNNYNNYMYKFITSYPPNGGFWSSSFANIDHSHIKEFVLKPLNLPPNIDFTSKLINPKNLKIHYIDGNTNAINFNSANSQWKFPDGSFLNSNNYEYIICRGNLNIIGADSNHDFNFKGLIYCDGNVIVSNVRTFGLYGIMISKGIINNNVGKWEGTDPNPNGITFNDNGGNLSDINTILTNITQ